MEYYRNTIAIITGAASGLGMALCKEISRRGATVIAVDIDRPGVEDLCQTLRTQGGKAQAAAVDVTCYHNIQGIIADTMAQHGRLDLIFNNAGTALHGEVRDLSLEHWQSVLDVNLMGLIHGTISAYGAMAKQGTGQIVNIASLAGLIPVPKEIPYCTSKWAVVGLTNALRLEGAGLGIKVNLVCPGIMQTPIHQTVSYINVDQQRLVRPESKRFLSPEKAAKIVLNGVEANQAMIIFPFYARLIWWCYRFNPSIFNLLFRKILKDFRKIRID